MKEKNEKIEKKSVASRRRKIIGLVISKKNEKTCKIEIEKRYFHSLYNKRIKSTRSYLVHDEKNEANIGDRVQVIESKPLSKLKRWRMVKIIEKAK